MNYKHEMLYYNIFTANCMERILIQPYPKTLNMQIEFNALLLTSQLFRRQTEANIW